MVLNVTSFPVLSKDENPSHGKMEASFLRALNEWNEDRTNTTTTLKAKGEMDKFLVHRNLFGGLTSEYFVPLENCVAEHCPFDYRPFEIFVGGSSQRACACVREEDYLYVSSMKELGVTRKVPHDQILEARKTHFRRSEAIEPLSKDTNFTYVPPPKTDITPALLDQSLASQPQDTATIGWIMAHFQGGVLSFGAQLNGLVAATMTLNASTDLPCDGIGGQQQPDLEIRPKDVDNGTAQTYIPDCQVVAVNMYNPDVINFWVLDKNGSIHSLVSSNKIINLGQLNSTSSTSLVLRAKQPGVAKREVSMHECSMAGHDIARRALEKRGLSAPGPHTATMTAEACAAMKCINNGGDPAIFNPFTNTCWCRDPVYVGTDHSA
ncbi:hypothetical protein LTR70_002934 [Exophiala xenobiotica]|nr:hypothetical protein LTR70_002934 [Exophiala xenobiotica]